MKSAYRKLAIIVLLFISTVLESLAQAEALTIGSISYVPARAIKKLKPLVDYLNSKIEVQGIGKVDIRITSNLGEMIALVKSGQVDIYIDSPFPSLKLAESGASEIVLRGWKYGVEKYHSVIFVHRNSDIKDITDLNGKLIAFEEPFSTSGYYLPKASLQQNGLKLSEMSNRYEEIASDEIGYVFSEDDMNTVTWVRKYRVSAGTIDNVRFDQIKPKFKDKLRIIFRSVDVPRQLVSYRKNISPVAAAALTQTLLDMHKSEYGQLQLQASNKTTKFDEFPVPIEEAMAPVRNLFNTFK